VILPPASYRASRAVFHLIFLNNLSLPCVTPFVKIKFFSTPPPPFLVIVFSRSSSFVFWRFALLSDFLLRFSPSLLVLFPGVRFPVHGQVVTFPLPPISKAFPSECAPFPGPPCPPSPLRPLLFFAFMGFSRRLLINSARLSMLSPSRFLSFLEVHVRRSEGRVLCSGATSSIPLSLYFPLLCRSLSPLFLRKRLFFVLLNRRICLY